MVTVDQKATAELQESYRAVRDKLQQSLDKALQAKANAINVVEYWERKLEEYKELDPKDLAVAAKVGNS